jgi:hypothetical protein
MHQWWCEANSGKLLQYILSVLSHQYYARHHGKEQRMFGGDTLEGRRMHHQSARSHLHSLPAQARTTKSIFLGHAYVFVIMEILFLPQLS